MEEKKFPVTEIFTSPQGEGRWTGHLMTFIRLAGCTVGKPFPKERYQVMPDEDWAPLPIYTEQCTLYDGRTFECDTDFRVKERLTAKEIAMRVEAPRVCITGGEPLMHNLNELLQTLACDVEIHIETSGTKSLKDAGIDGFDRSIKKSWISVSPKKGALHEMLVRADEIKLLVDERFDEQEVPNVIYNKKNVYLQPVNYEHEINDDNMKRCIEIQKRHGSWAISTQAHKTWKVR